MFFSVLYIYTYFRNTLNFCSYGCTGLKVLMACLRLCFIKISFSCSICIYFFTAMNLNAKKTFVVRDLFYETLRNSKHPLPLDLLFGGHRTHAYSLHFAQFGVFRTTIPIGARKLNVAHLPRVLNVYIAHSVRVPQATFVTMIRDPRQIWHDVGSARAADATFRWRSRVSCATHVREIFSTI